MATVSKQEARQLPPGEEEPGVCETRPPRYHSHCLPKWTSKRSWQETGAPPGKGPARVCRVNSPHKLCFSSISRLGSDFVCPDPEGSQ